MLELFTSKSSCEDYKIRALLLESLAAVSPMVEVNIHLRASASATLKVYKEIEIKDGEIDLYVSTYILNILYRTSYVY